MTVLLTVEEAAERLRTTAKALRKRMDRGDIDHIKDGRRYAMTERQVEDHIAACTVIRKTEKDTPLGRYFPEKISARG